MVLDGAGVVKQGVAVTRADPTVIAVEAAIADLYRLANNPEIHRARQRRLGTDLSRTELEALRRVDDLGPIGVTKVSEVLGLSLAATSRMLARLDHEGYLERRGDPDDGRVARYATTDAGQAVRRQFQASTQAEVAAVLAGWDVADRERLAALFVRLVDEMKSDG
jgi:DNA-binding MarR family transcriptional regulator